MTAATPAPATTALVVGAGPTGLVMAHELARHGVACRVVEKRTARSDRSRALALHARTLEAFELMRADADAFVACGHPVRGGRIYADNGKRQLAHLAFDHLRTRYPFILVLPQDETERLLEAHLARRGVAIERPVELVDFRQDEGGIAARLKRPDGGVEECRADWLIGCDGAHSAVRHGLGYGFAGAEYEDEFLLADLTIDGDLDRDEFRLYAADDGLLALFPMRDGRHRIVADTGPAVASREPTLAECQAIVDARGPGGLHLRDPRWLAAFRIHRRHAPHLRRGRVFLAGDAAHIHSPAGGQGMNTGIQDAFNLAWKLGLAARGAADPALLDSYEAERLPVDEAVIRLADRMTRLATLRNPAARFLRDHLMPLLSGLETVRDQAGETLSELAVHYRGSPIVEEHKLPGGGPAAGERAPDATLMRPDGGAVRLYDLVAAGGYTLLAFEEAAERHERAAAAIAALSEDPASVSLFRIAPDAPRGDGAALIDRDGAVAALYGGAPALVLVRPDGYIGFRAPLDEDAGERLRAHLRRVLGAAPGGASANRQ